MRVLRPILFALASACVGPVAQAQVFNPGSGASAGNVGGYTAVGVASFVRPANTTAYAAGQMLCQSATASSCTAVQIAVSRTAGGTGMVRRARLTTSSPATTNAQFDLMVFRPADTSGACPTAQSGDGAAFATDSALRYLGHIPVTIDQAFSDGAKGIGIPASGSEINFDTPVGFSHLCVFVKALAGYTPTANETFTPALEVLQN